MLQVVDVRWRNPSLGRRFWVPTLLGGLAAGALLILLFVVLLVLALRVLKLGGRASSPLAGLWRWDRWGLKPWRGAQFAMASRPMSST